MKVLVRTALFLLLFLAGVAILAFYWTFYRPLPDYSAEIRLSGLQEEVEIHWDSFGVPHIYAGSEPDLYYALGYVHAQDRLWQMTLTQITAEGRFAEFFGEELIDLDLHQRTLGFWETARRIEQQAPPEILDLLESYSRGVNDFVEKNRRHLPIEFTLTGIDPFSWSPVRSFVLSRLIAWEMNNSWWNEIIYSILAERHPPEVVQQLMPDYPEWTGMAGRYTEGPVADKALAMVDREFRLRELTGRTGAPAGSNAWAVSGEQTESGYPLLAGDPHLGLWMPGHWYEVHLHLNGRNVSGATIPGAPVVVLGQNDHFAWTLTNIMADDTDFFLERVAPHNPELYLADSLQSGPVWEPFEWREEVVKIKGGDDLLLRVRSTRRGPVISDIHPAGPLEAAGPDGSHLIAMQWVGHQVSQELLALYRINWSESFQEFLQALEGFHSPGQNFIYADRQDNIALISAARLPVRDGNPVLLRKGWDPDQQWKGWIPFDQLPRTVNPGSGYVANANNRLHDDRYPWYIATFWEPPSRIQRIEEWLSGQTPRRKMTVNDFQQMQLDNYSVHARDLMEQIYPVLRRMEDRIDFQVVAPYLENWDFRYETGSTAATILDAFFIRLIRNTLQDELGEEDLELFLRLKNVPVQVMNRLLQENTFLFDDATTRGLESREEIIARSMQEAIEWLRREYGEEPFQWRWENVHTVSLRPPLFSDAASEEGASRLLQLIVNNLLSKGPFPVGGHAMSINKGQYDLLEPFRMKLGPSIRRVVDLAQPGRSLSVLPTGQSGNPLSDFFGDQTDLWLHGQYRYLYHDNTFFHEVSYQTMRLIPDR